MAERERTRLESVLPPGDTVLQSQLFEYVCAVPTEDQYGGSLLFDFTRNMWPDLLEVPYCRVTANHGTYLPKWVRVGIKRILGPAGVIKPEITMSAR